MSNFISALKPEVYVQSSRLSSIRTFRSGFFPFFPTANAQFNILITHSHFKPFIRIRIMRWHPLGRVVDGDISKLMQLPQRGSLNSAAAAAAACRKIQLHSFAFAHGQFVCTHTSRVCGVAHTNRCARPSSDHFEFSTATHVHT